MFTTNIISINMALMTPQESLIPTNIGMNVYVMPTLTTLIFIINMGISTHMINRILAYSLHHRLTILLLALVALVYGTWTIGILPVVESKYSHGPRIWTRR